MRTTITTIIAALAIALLLCGCTETPPRKDATHEISSFEECAAAGNPVMESYPRQCAADGKTFAEAVETPPEEPPRPIGGDKDENGCLVAAGYSWCPSTQKCQRMWEEYCEEYKDNYRGDEVKTPETPTTPEPRACTMEYMPVCGTDGKTYGNKCTAGDVEIAHQGECTT